MRLSSNRTPDRLSGRRRKIGGLAALVGRSFPDAIEIGMGVVANADLVGDRPFEARGQQDVGAGEAVAHQIDPAIGERGLDMTQLLAKIFARSGDDVGRDAIDMTERIGLVAAAFIRVAALILQASKALRHRS